jgi:hypothetical protein
VRRSAKFWTLALLFLLALLTGMMLPPSWMATRDAVEWYTR